MPLHVWKISILSSFSNTRFHLKAFITSFLCLQTFNRSLAFFLPLFIVFTIFFFISLFYLHKFATKMSYDSNRSGNSKRSFNSHSSNNTNNKSSNKKKKTNQKTLGVAWGANSLSSSRSSFRSAPFSDFGRYYFIFPSN